MFKDELFSGTGPITVYINSPGGDCIAASQIYTMLMDYKGNVTVKIDGIAASAASVIAMAGTNVFMAPTAMIMIHNPATIAMGDHKDMKKAIDMLSEVKESIINAYELKTGQSRTTLSHLMDAETWMNANKAIELGFANGFIDDRKKNETVNLAFSFSRKEAANILMNKIIDKSERTKIPEEKVVIVKEPFKGVTKEQLMKRLNILNHYRKGVISMDKIIELRQKRAKTWEETKKFLDSHADENELLSAEDEAAYDKMEADITRLGGQIERLERQKALDAELSLPVNKPITEKPASVRVEEKTGTAGDNYRKFFWDFMRTSPASITPAIKNALQIGTDTEGGYLVPDEF